MNTRAITATASGHWSTRDLISLTKPRLSGLVIATAAGGVWLAQSETTLLVMVAAVIGTTLVVGAANAYNCILERDTDALMTRTQNRPLAAGRMAPPPALVFATSLAVMGLSILGTMTNGLTTLLAAFALFMYVMVYTPLKRRSPAATLVGGIPGALPPLMGWTAATGRIDAPGLVLFAVVFFWQIPHFLAIALFRKDEFRRAGMRVLPLVAGDDTTRRQIVRYSAVLLPVSLMLYPLGAAGLTYLILAAVLGITLLGYAVRGLRTTAANRWAREFFFGTLLYLTFLVGALVVDRIIAM